MARTHPRPRPVGQLKVGPRTTVADLVREFRSAGFTAGRVAEAADLWEEMARSGATRFLTLSGALVPAGMRNLLSGLVRDGYVDVLVTSGATLVHDLVEALGGRHYAVEPPWDDAALRRRGLNRIYDVAMPDRDFIRLEKHLQRVLEPLEGRTLSLRQLLEAIADSVTDRRSILRAARDRDVPLFCPALADSAIGLQVWLFLQRHRLVVDAFADMRDLIDICYRSERAGIVVLGGGVPKNFALQAMMVTPKGFDWVVQVTTDRPETGGLSGAPPVEAVSWGKVRSRARTVVVPAEATLALPLLAAALRARVPPGRIGRRP